jgi:non-homologous end joining protein Ku
LSTLRSLITRKAKDEEPTVDEDEEPTSNVVDLMAALEASVAGRPPKAAARANKRASNAGRATNATAAKRLRKASTSRRRSA